VLTQVFPPCTDVQESKPTGDQLNSILEYLGPNAADTVVEGATGPSDALKLFKQDEVVLKRPIVVDWNNGRAGTSSR
jgi:arsenate reductase-like glutaredoxin family protein